ncbi:peptidase, M20D family, partial [gut metagenome]
MNYVQNAVNLRRELHRIPELGWGEFCTTARIIKELDGLGWKVYAGLDQIGLD